MSKMQPFWLWTLTFWTVGARAYTHTQRCKGGMFEVPRSTEKRRNLLRQVEWEDKRVVF